MFAGIGVREPQPAASEAFTMFGEAHREIERFAVRMLKTVKPVSRPCLIRLRALSKFYLLCVIVNT